MKKKKREKFKPSGFRGYNYNEWRNLEENYYFIHLGGDFQCIDGIYNLTQKEAIGVYSDIFDDLVGTAEEGLSEKDRAHAKELLGSLWIQPARLH